MLGLDIVFALFVGSVLLALLAPLIVAIMHLVWWIYEKIRY